MTEGRYQVVLAGDVDYARKNELDDLAAAYEAGDAASARVEMSEVTFIDSHGLSFLIRLRNTAEARGGEVEVAEPSERVLYLLRLVNLDGRFHISGTDEGLLAGP